MHNRLAVVAVLVGLVLLPSVSSAFTNERMGAISGVVGGMLYLADEDSKDSAKPRPSFGGTGEYSMSARSAVRLDITVGWNAYSPSAEDRERFGHPKPVKIVNSNILSYIRRINPDSERFLYAGGGFGLYYWRYKISGKFQHDGDANKKIGSGKIFSFDPGVHALAGYEYPLSESVSLQAEALGHFIFSANEEDRPSGWNGNDAYVAIRLGVKVYFDLTRFVPPEDLEE